MQAFNYSYTGMASGFYVLATPLYLNVSRLSYLLRGCGLTTLPINRAINELRTMIIITLASSFWNMFQDESVEGVDFESCWKKDK